MTSDKLLTSGMAQVKARVLSHRRVAPDHYRMRLMAPAVAVRSLPGQFIHVRCGEKSSGLLLRRPFSLLDVDRKEGAVDFIYKVVGVGTQALTEIPIGSKVDLLGPLGEPFQISADLKRVYLIGGGVGIPPLYFLAEELVRQKMDDSPPRLVSDKGGRQPAPAGERQGAPGKTEVKVFLGARTSGWVICQEMFLRLGVETHVATDDGTLGHKGSVIDLLERFLQSTIHNPQSTMLYICGPTPMMYAAAMVAQKRGLSAQVSLEERMGCAMGCCMGCVVEVRTGPIGSHARFQRVCTEGPVFPADKIVWQSS